MTAITEVVRERLRGVLDPCSVAAGNAMEIVEMGLVDRLEVREGRVDVHLRLTSPTCPMLEHFAREMRRVLSDVPGVDSINVHPDTGMDWTQDHIAPQARARRRLHLAALRDRSHRSEAEQ